MEEELRKCKSEKVMEGGAEVTNGNSGKKRKLQTDSSQFESHEVNLVCPAIFETSYCSKDHESSGFVKENLSSTDLKTEGYETEISVPIINVSRETSPTRDLYGDSEKSLMEFSPQSKKKKPFSPTNPCQITSAADSKTPSAKELEEFFAAEEKYQQQRFAEKYNYDIVNDVPLEGRYEWVRLKP
ncbi:cyclin-dependent kinase inhibitor 7-like [Olea europaea subsp. europaea]|uniref:Cyclin-dependent kinase inhibitor 7-like n=1 Tax=Olea europaea subsp. europaea TaxID=158383 RepID=A0A8S0VAE7_OLEEU|nr:cyclin-dependent kinase inhibitor 7-like [Olea europaea subsp. europaea]